MSRPRLVPDLKSNGQLTTLLKLNQEYDLANQLQQKFRYKSPLAQPFASRIDNLSRNGKLIKPAIK